MKTSLKIGSVWGIPIELHITFILLLAAEFVLSYPQLDYFLLVVFLFVFVTLHELSHSIVARHYDIRVRKIILYPIGGVSEIEEINDQPSVEWRMAIAGPLMSFLIAGVLLAINQVVAFQAPLTPSLIVAGSYIFNLAFLNVLLGAFNLIPAFPMDGGRVFRALLAERLSFSDATRYAAIIGRFMGIVMVGFGIFYNFWFIIVGAFIYIGATEEAESTIISTAIARIRVSEIMLRDVATVTPETTLTEALEVMLRARYHDALVEKEGAIQGVVCWDEIVKVKPEERNRVTMGQIEAKHVSISPDEPVLEAYKVMEREKIHLVPVVDKEGKTVGVITSESINYAIARNKNLAPA